MYKLSKNLEGVINAVIKTDGDIYLCIPLSEANTDYQEYLKWLAEGNTPEPADD
jgi:hypothetical protein